MLNKLIVILFLTGILYMNSLNAHNNKAVEIGQYHTIKSQILKADRTIQIYLPDSYTLSDKKYPVLYILMANGILLMV